MPEPLDALPRALNRRSALGLAAAAALVLPLAACGVQLEANAPDVPLVPTRKPIEGEAGLIALLQETLSLAGWATALGGAATSLPARLAALHRHQADVLRDRLRASGVPEKLLAPAPAAGTVAAAPGTPTTLGAHEAGSVSAASLATTSHAPADLFPMTAAMLAQRVAAARLLSARAPLPAATWPSGAPVTGMLEATRAAVYGFEVIAAQTDAAHRALAKGALASLRVRAAAQTTAAGADAPLPPLGYALPYPVTTPSAAARLAVRVLTELRASLGEGLTAISDHREATATVVGWLGETEFLLTRWGGQLAPFPGLA